MRMFRFKSLLPTLLSALLLQNANAWVFEDHFNYSNGANLGATTGGGGTNWTLSGGDVSQIKVTTASTQTAPSGYAPASGLGVAVTPTGSRKQTGVPFNGATGIPVADGNVVYASFLLNVQTLATNNLRVAYMHNVATSSGGAIELWASSTGQVGISKKGSTVAFVSGTPVASNGTHLVVMRYAFQSGNDEVAIWVDPDSASYGGTNTAPTTGTYIATTTGSDMANAILDFIIESAAVTGPAFWIDEVRVGTTWGDVTPSGNAPPSISSGPTNQTASVGQDVDFSVQAGGTPPLNYQWYFNTNTLLTAATNATLTLTNVQLSDEGGYSVLVTNPYGSVTSTVAQLTVNVLPPSIDLDPQNQSVLVGQNATFDVQASGTAPLSYQWYYNTNSPIGYGTNSSLTVTNAQLPDTGAYSALVSNAYGSVTSAVAQLTVSAPVAPTITGQPQDTTVYPGSAAAFNVTASGSEPLSYQWYFNNSTLLTGATLSTLTITNAQLANAGSYSAVVNNIAGSATSSNAVLTINTNPVAPWFTMQPNSQVVPSGGTASFTALAAGTAPITYRWNKNGVPVPGATASTLTLTNVQVADNGSYSAVASNSVGTATSSNAVLTVTTSTPIVNSDYNLVGFGEAVTGGGVIATNDAAYRQVHTDLEFATAVRDANKTAGSVKVIEIMNDLNLGWNEIDPAVKALSSTPFTQPVVPKLHPVLLTTGVSTVQISPKTGLTIFSANGATIRHASWSIKATSNVIIRNLKFDELWEWDEESKGDYDKNNWDFIVIGVGGGEVSNLWIDHCTFTKSYDGIIDTKGGAGHITYSWNKYVGDDGATNPNSFVWKQINALESNKASYAMYNFLRTHGFSSTDVVTIVQGPDKTQAIGELSLKPENTNSWITFHHQYYINTWDRLPRMAGALVGGGNVHNFNIYVDDTGVLAARRLRDAIAATMSPADQNTLNNTYNFKPPINGSICTEHSAMLVEKSVYIDCNWPLRNNQTDPSNSVYTGKIKALDTIYQYDSTFVRGNSTDPGNPLGPFQAPIIPFSWNLPGGALPYTYTMDDPSQLQSIVTSPTAGAGAGVLTWNKTNWLMTAYAPTAPIISADPQNQTVTNGQAALFICVAYGSDPLTYQWYFNTNTPIANATNSALTIASVQPGDVGTYSVIVSNSAGTATSAQATLTISSTFTPFETWQLQYWGCTNCPEAAGTADPDGDGLDNQSEFLAGTSPTNNLSALRITSVVPQGSDIVIEWNTAGGRTNRVQAAPGNPGYDTNGFADIGGPIIIPGTSDNVTTNYTDDGGATNIPSRFYRVRIVP